MQTDSFAPSSLSLCLSVCPCIHLMPFPTDHARVCFCLSGCSNFPLPPVCAYILGHFLQKLSFHSYISYNFLQTWSLRLCIHSRHPRDKITKSWIERICSVSEYWWKGGMQCFWILMKRGYDRGQCLEGKDTTGRPRGSRIFTELMEFLFNYFFLHKPVSFIPLPRHYIFKKNDSVCVGNSFWNTITKHKENHNSH